MLSRPHQIQERRRCAAILSGLLLLRPSTKAPTQSHDTSNLVRATLMATLPEDAPLWPVHRQGGQCLIHVEAAALDRLRAMRRPGTFPFTGSLEEPLSVQRRRRARIC